MKRNPLLTAAPAAAVRRQDIIPGNLIRGLRPDEATAVVGSEKVLEKMVSAGWIVPVVQRKGLTLYDRGHLLAAWNRLCREGSSQLWEPIPQPSPAQAS